MKTCDLEQSIEYSAFDVNVTLSNPYVGPLPRITISLFLISICTDELISTPKIITFLPQSKFGIEENDKNQIQFHMLNTNI